MSSIFSKIISGEIPSYKVAENEKFLAFLDINPNTRGHTLCVPKNEVDDFIDLDPELFKELMSFSRDVALAIKKTIPCKKVALSIIGLEVPHVHVHLIPITAIKDVAFINKAKLDKDEFISTAEKIASAYSSL
ncbi:MAG: HIT domain-containing protein [Flavobacteriaceae bacterium]|jgi:histidine triad (HIT) family protein|nr:HIT domain-containing protein [Flavobacteriaceae bacterium]MBT4113953.1 HIT domain-containing protein [Flavobacteriaceae bacterium]MBT4613847.1 HIT domain-containing protein [Flavobacteriaceae bacterium]MBT5246414.1 HIT domain-containing protein [Flavobacteriaceae bacterium]MBT5650759.1 HIT domain-containing protein [Flavobacteriaceae bacterium]|tara:strand:+ start:284 stop:682 length:399 start_codon:yes stop_codon:yes gene_type:complete